MQDGPNVSTAIKPPGVLPGGIGLDRATRRTARDVVGILIVADPPARLSRYEAVLSRLGHGCVHARTAEDSLRELAARPFAAVLVDLGASLQVGLQAARLIQRHPACERMPVIVVAQSLPDGWDAGHGPGVIELVPATVPLELLRARVRLLVEIHRQRRELELLNERLAVANTELADANVALRAENRGALQALNASLTAANADLARTNQALKVEIDQRIEAQKKLEAADRRKDEFIAMLSHELRNPLAAMHGVIELMSRGQTDPASLARIREVLTRQNRHLTRLIEDLLDVSRITRGTLTLRCEAVDARVIVQHALEATAAAVAARGHEIAVAMPDAPVMVWGDPVRLTQVVTNLLDNAAKFTPPGGHIRLDMSDRETGPTGKPWVTIDVEDDGCGIDARLLPEIFEPLPHFERMHRGIHGGLGIGLTVVRNLVLMHGGRAQVHSDGPERGSRFTVRLPLHDRTMTPTTMSLATSSDNKSGVPALRILVVDDNEDSAESMSLLLQCDGHRVDTAYSGEAALRIATEQPPDVMLLDIGMPGMMGYEVAERLRAGNFARTLLIAVTGYGRDSDIARARAAGFDHHLVKPVDYDKLRAMLAERFGGSPGAGARP